MFAIVWMSILSKLLICNARTKGFNGLLSVEVIELLNNESLIFEDQNVEPFLVAQCFKCSNCTATFMDVHALWSLLDDWRQGNSSCDKLL